MKTLSVRYFFQTRPQQRLPRKALQPSRTGKEAPRQCLWKKRNREARVQVNLDTKLDQKGWSV
jgi:hypothetical protein